MKKSLQSSGTMLVLLAGIAIISASSLSVNEAFAKPHASLLLEPDPNDPNQEHVNTIRVVLGHTNEPSFGKLPGLHDGKHFLEVELSDDATTLPIGTASLFADKYYFKDATSFENAQSLQDADQKELNVPISAVFGSPGLFYNRQVQDPGIYGYTLRGSINYFDVGTVPIKDTTIFCSISGQELSKFNSEGWSGSYGCTQNLKSIFFPESVDKPDKYPPKYPEYGNYGTGYGEENKNQYQTINSEYRVE